MRSTLTITISLFHDEPLDPKNVKEEFVKPISNGIQSACVYSVRSPIKDWKVMEDESILHTETHIEL